MSNNEVYPKNHDEVDFEFLGTVPGEPYTIQTNIYGNGVTHIGREQRFHLWFDPTESFHNYSLLWTTNHTVFFVDNIPIWEFSKLEEIGAQYPSKQMSLYATIWDASRWATDGGRYRVDYQYQPFTATYANFIVKRCSSYSFSMTISQDLCTSVFNISNPSQLTEKQQEALKWVQLNHRVYSYCTDIGRYPDMTEIPECAAERAEATNQTRMDHA
ncbi:hypothetical protein R1sor_000670 [Riccia sorocarpa]|uniref:Xyloglucan endotransglucosylase/hydrolase n=1 Tax=Riccia sorocarpa TaxID=122646 RepID=A0ABD3GU29_9MARC